MIRATNAPGCAVSSFRILGSAFTIVRPGEREETRGAAIIFRDAGQLELEHPSNPELPPRDASTSQPSRSAYRSRFRTARLRLCEKGAALPDTACAAPRPPWTNVSTRFQKDTARRLHRLGRVRLPGTTIPLSTHSGRGNELPRRANTRESLAGPAPRRCPSVSSAR